MSVLPDRFIENMEKRPDSVSESDISSFTAWINSELEAVLGDGLEEDRLAAIHVAMIAGGHVVGQGQNEGGEIAVAMLKQALVDHFRSEDKWNFRTEDGQDWIAVAWSVDARYVVSKTCSRCQRRHSGSGRKRAGGMILWSCRAAT